MRRHSRQGQPPSPQRQSRKRHRALCSVAMTLSVVTLGACSSSADTVAARHDATDSQTRSGPVHAGARSVSGCKDLHRDLTGTIEHHPQRRIHMTTSTVGLLAGLLLGVAAAAGGFTGFLIALVLGVIGYLVGGQRDGEFDLGVMLKGRGRG